MRRLSAVALAICLVLLAAGCSDEPTPKFADPTAPPTSVETSEVVAPTTTPVTPEPEPLGPEETVRAWVEARNELLRSGDGASVGSLSSDNCRSCRDLNAGIEEIYDAGGFFRTKGWIVKGVNRKPQFASDGVVAAAVVFSSGVTRLDSGSTPVPYAEEKNFLDFALTRVGDRWVVADVVFLA
jgi:hypothetical protein